MATSRELVSNIRKLAEAMEIAIKAAIESEIDVTLTFSRENTNTVNTVSMCANTHIVVGARQTRSL